MIKGLGISKKDLNEITNVIDSMSNEEQIKMVLMLKGFQDINKKYGKTLADVVK